MSLFLTAIIVITAFLALYWVFYGQRKYNEMLMPKRKTELKAILFDFDGVLIDSFDAWHHVFNQTRKHFKLTGFDKDKFRKKAWGKILDTELKENFPNQDVEEIKDQYRTLIKKHYHKTKLLPDAREVLETVKNKKIKIGLVTNTFKEPAIKTLNFHKIRQYFNVVITPDDVEKPKPYPDPILKACEKLEVQPDEVIYVGDTKNDYKAGKAAGAFVVGLNTHGDLSISRLSDLLQLL
ncbi:HAD family hydrolase [Candidatus Woesearchaeota archaeon]|nr:HAD family hydrolase [Candidatus Woesearchaeota archaeon]